MKKSVITIIGRLKEDKPACGHQHSEGGCSGHHQAKDACGCGGHDHAQQDACGCGHDHHAHEGGHDHSCGHGCGQHAQVLSDMEQFVLLKDYIIKVDMQDEITLQFMDWTEEMPAKYPKIADLLENGYELPMVAIDDAIRLAGAVRPEKVIHLVNEMRQAQSN